MQNEKWGEGMSQGRMHMLRYQIKKKNIGAIVDSTGG